MVQALNIEGSLLQLYIIFYVYSQSEYAVHKMCLLIGQEFEIQIYCTYLPFPWSPFFLLSRLCSPPVCLSWLSACLACISRSPILVTTCFKYFCPAYFCRLISCILKRDFFGFLIFMYLIQHCFICRPSDSTVSEDAGIESRTVATSALTARRSKHSARFHLPV